MHQSILRYNDISLAQLIWDLKWVVKSPGLLDVVPPQASWHLLPDNYFIHCLDWIDDIEKKPQNLKAFFSVDQQFILGKYFEKLLHYIFMYSSSNLLITMGLQIEKNNRTIGEIDFIYRDLLRKKNVHLEVAVKYYMGFGASPKHAMWIGPNGLDNLEGKIKKFSHQLSMSGFTEQLTAMNPSGFDKKVLLKGYFFQYLDTDLLPHFHHPEVLTGWWIFIDSIKKIINPDSMYIIVPKQFWLGFYLEQNIKRYKGIRVIDVVETELKIIGKGILLAELDESGCHIKTKYMVVPDYWPRILVK